MPEEFLNRVAARRSTAINRHADSAPVDIPPGHIGPVVLPGSGRLVWWTGRVAIGLRHQPAPRVDGISGTALWVQQLMLDRPAAAQDARAGY